MASRSTVPDAGHQPTVFVIDDDRDIRMALQSLLRSVSLRCQLFASPREFLAGARPPEGGCLVIDVRLPERNGLDFHDDLVKANVRLPVIFISGYADIPMSVRAMKAGAVDFLAKPFRDQDLLDAIQAALERDRGRRDRERATARIRADFDRLTPRERDVMRLVAAGRLNKQAAASIGISEATVKAHRSQVMRKMQVRSVVELVRLADQLEFASPKS